MVLSPIEMPWWRRHVMLKLLLCRPHLEQLKTAANKCCQILPDLLNSFVPWSSLVSNLIHCHNDHILYYNILQTDWWFGTFFYFSIQLGMSSSQLTNSYFSEGWRKTTNCRLDGHSSGIDRSIPHCLGISPHWIYFSPYRMGPAGPQSIAFSCLISGWILWFMLDIGTYKVISINHFYGYYRYRMI